MSQEVEKKMAREMTVWEVGQRAIVNGQPCTWRLPVYRTDGPEVWVADTGHLVTKDVESVYPLLTLDPDNPEQMEALYQAWWSHSFGGQATRFADAVRSLLPAPVLPPVPPTPEPNGRGAYVESMYGHGWSREDGYWRSSGDFLSNWSLIGQPVTVHFHGVGCTCAGPGCPDGDG